MSSPTAPESLSEIGQIALTMADVPRSTAFYRDVLGLKFLFSAGPTMSFFAAGSVRLMLSTPQGAGEPGKNSILYFKTADIRATYTTILGRGATAVSEPHRAAKMPTHELWLAAVRDPEGNVIELMSEV